MDHSPTTCTREDQRYHWGRLEIVGYMLPSGIPSPLMIALIAHGQALSRPVCLSLCRSVSLLSPTLRPQGTNARCTCAKSCHTKAIAHTYGD
eukprot:1231024-Amphidinium_carterae.2